MAHQQVQESLGPYLQVACFCDNVVQRADGVLTLVNIIDRIIITAQGSTAPETMPPTNWLINLAIILKAGRARGRYEMRIVPELPDGTSKEALIRSVNLEGEDDRGVQIINQMAITLTHEGLHWFNIYLGDTLLTRLPLRVVYNRLIGGATGLRQQIR